MLRYKKTLEVTMERIYADFAWEKASSLLGIDSPSGYTARAASWVRNTFADLGFAAHITTKGGVIVDLGGENSDDALLLSAHTDTLGGMVAQIKGNGRLRITALGGMNACNGETENVRVYTRTGTVIEGTLQLCNASIHVNGGYNDAKRNFDTTEVLLDAKAESAEDVKKLGIEVGDIVCFDPRTRRTESGYLKSRFLDDKLSVGILIAFARYLADNKIQLKRRTYMHITVYEEVGHGGSGSVPEGVTEAIAVDMGCVGDGLQCTERQVSICAKDSGGPYNYEVVGKLIEAAKASGADYAVDVYPYYGSDVEATLRSGFDIRHGLIGPGVYASHGYERSHIDGVHNTLKLLKEYVK
jgi:putative aminopeptidase FrvX